MEKLKINGHNHKSIYEIGAIILSNSSVLINEHLFLLPLHIKLQKMLEEELLFNYKADYESQKDFIANLREVHTDFSWFRKHIESLCHTPDSALANSAKLLWLIIEQHTANWNENTTTTLEEQQKLLNDLAAEHNRTFIEATRLRGWLDKLLKSTDSLIKIERQHPVQYTKCSLFIKYLNLFIDGLAILEATHTDSQSSTTLQTINTAIKNFNKNTTNRKSDYSNLYKFAIVA